MKHGIEHHVEQPTDSVQFHRTGVEGWWSDQFVLQLRGQSPRMLPDAPQLHCFWVYFVSAKSRKQCLDVLASMALHYADGWNGIDP